MVLFTLLLILAFMAVGLGACTPVSRESDRLTPVDLTPVIHRSQSVSYREVPTNQVIDEAEAIFIGRVMAISPSRWNQDSGKYWEDEKAEMATLQYYEVTLEVEEFIVNDIGLGSPVVLTVLGPSPADNEFGIHGNAPQRAITGHLSFQREERALLFVKYVPMAWRGGPKERLMLVGGPQGKYTITEDGQALNASSAKRNTTLTEIRKIIAVRRRGRP